MRYILILFSIIIFVNGSMDIKKNMNMINLPCVKNSNKTISYCQEKIQIAWKEFFMKNNLKLAKNILYKDGKKCENILIAFKILKASIFYEEGNYQESLRISNSLKQNFATFYIKSTQKNDKIYQASEFFYSMLLIISGLSNYKLEKWIYVIDDFKLILKLNFLSHEKYSHHIYLASAYSAIDKYQEAIIELKKSYKLKKKDETRFSLAFVYFEKNDIDKSIYWIKQIENKTLWISRVETQFSKIRDSKKLKVFLEKLKVQYR